VLKRVLVEVRRAVVIGDVRRLIARLSVVKLRLVRHKAQVQLVAGWLVLLCSASMNCASVRAAADGPSRGTRRL
jgi:hypothetical protein